MPKNKKMPKNRILLCACKKYLRFQKNGILLLSFEDDNNIDNYSFHIYYKFYYTNDFQVFCFCPISIFTDEQIIENKSNKNETDYFFAGGFDSKKNKGIIKLYKVIYGEEFNKIRIEFIQDIFDGKKRKTFNGPISCITQSSIDGKVLVTCWNGNIYIFEYADISYYIEYDKQVNEKISFNKFFEWIWWEKLKKYF